MSVDFKVKGIRADYEDLSSYLNLANGNAALLLSELGLPPEDGELYGSCPARDLAARCRRLLWPERADPGTETKESGGPGTAMAKVIDVGRRSGYLQEKAQQLLALCERAGEGEIEWA